MRFWRPKRQAEGRHAHRLNRVSASRCHRRLRTYGMQSYVHTYVCKPCGTCDNRRQFAPHRQGLQGERHRKTASARDSVSTRTRGIAAASECSCTDTRPPVVLVSRQVCASCSQGVAVFNGRFSISCHRRDPCLPRASWKCRSCGRDACCDE